MFRSNQVAQNMFCISGTYIHYIYDGTHLHITPRSACSHDGLISLHAQHAKLLNLLFLVAFPNLQWLFCTSFFHFCDLQVIAKDIQFLKLLPRIIQHQLCCWFLFNVIQGVSLCLNCAE